MSSYQISAEGVAGVLTSIETPLADLMANFESLSGAAQTVFDNDGMTDTVSGAIAQLFEDQKGRISTISTRVNAATSGAYFATLAYVQGDEQMCSDTQTAAVQASQTGDFSYFEARAAEL